MSVEKSLEKLTTKYHCMVTGQKAMEPCDGCSNPKGCLSRAMQYKENEEMSEMDEKAVVKLNADGDVTACAKGLSPSECGYKAGAKVCGACGAMAVTEKGAMEPAEDQDSAYTDEMNEVLAKRKKREEKLRASNLGVKARPAPVDMSATEEEDDEMDDNMEDDIEEASMMKPKRRSRARAMMAMGVKSDDLDDPDGAFLCQFDRKVMPSGADVCSNCPGGCAAEDGMPGILDIEGMALDLFGGKVLSSGYADEADLFIVDVLGKDGRAVEILADGTTGEILNFHRLNADDLGSAFAQKSAEDAIDFKVIDIKSAETIALGVLASEVKTAGDIVQADSEIFEGYDAYVFEVAGQNGKSYDVYVGIDGTALGYDEYDSVEAEEIEAEAAEIALKRAYGEDALMKMVEEGVAMADGSFPIQDATDLHNAIQAFSRAADKPATKSHIMKRARALDAYDLIPEDWMQKADSFTEEEIEIADVELKRAYSEDDRTAMAKRGLAMPDGSFPIKDRADLMNAIKAHGRAKDIEAAKKHIIKRAMDLGLEDMIPVEWVPKKIQDQASGAKADDPNFIASLMEFELLAAEEDFKDTF